MKLINKIFAVLLIISFLALPKSYSSAQAAPTFPTGTLVYAQGDNAVYYIENGLKRPIDSWETLQRQGFQAIIKNISAIDLAAYPVGEIVTKDSTLVVAGQEAVVPDLAPFAASDLQLVSRDGRRLLLFTTELWNRGSGPLELLATSSTPSADDVYETAQRIVLPNGQVRSKVVGNIFWHAIHKHFHYDDFASYVLEMLPPRPQVLGAESPIVPPVIVPPPVVISPPMHNMPGMEGMHEMPAEPSLLPPMASVLGVSTTPPAIRNKSTFCLYETNFVTLPSEGPKNPRKSYTTCGKYKQGLSVGWADRYAYTLPDQNFDVTDLPAGIYRLSFVIDPREQFMEGTRGNNVSVAFVDLNPAAGTMRVLASGSPFFTPDNHYPNGMLVRSESDPKVYILQNNKKQLLKSPPSTQPYILPQGVLDAIPSLSLIQAAGSPTIYMLNENGFRRGITSLEIFNSYGLRFEDVTTISGVELVNYPETDLVKRQGDDVVYSLTTRRSVSTADQSSVHAINQTDFEAYMVDIAVSNLFVPWDVAFLPDGDMLIPERSGALRRSGKTPGVISVPSVMSTGEGGLMGIALHPQFSENKLLYLYYTTSEGGQKNRVARFRLNGWELTDRTIIIDNIPSAIYHDGGRIAFGPDGMLYVTTGDANNPASAQDTNSLAGKTLRVTADGDIPEDNPFGTAVWSYGHRNSQGIAWDNLGRMWQTEHGRSGATTGFDELNLVEKGKNYGWPTIQGSAARDGMVTPILNSGANETWAPAGIVFMNGSLYFAGLLGSKLYQVNFQANGNVLGMKTHFAGQFGRLRAAVAGPDGALYISTSNRDGRGTVRGGDDKILRVRPGFLQSFR